jgi:dephospho-CoA kinase
LKVIAVTGMPGSGKEEFVTIAEEEGISVVRMGDVVRAEVKNRGLELTDPNIGRIAHDEREKHGFGIWAKKTVPLVKGETVLIDGVRGYAELEVFKRSFAGELTVVGIHTSPQVRYDRIKKRQRKDATMTWEAFCERDSRELGWGIGDAIALCDHMIVNEGSLDEFRENVKELLLSIK